MQNYRTPRKEENTSRRARRASQKKVMLIGWIFLGVMLAAALAAVILLLPGRDKAPDTEDRPLSVPQLNPGVGGSAFQTEQTAAPIKSSDTADSFTCNGNAAKPFLFSLPIIIPSFWDTKPLRPTCRATR